MINVWLIHMVLLLALSLVLSYHLKFFFKQIIILFPFTLIVCVLLNSYLNLYLFFNAIINVTVYAIYIQYAFQRKLTDALYLSISYWICIELVDLLQQFVGAYIYSRQSIVTYISMLFVILVAYMPFLYLDKVEKKFLMFVLPATLCLFMIQALNDEANDMMLLMILMGLFVSNVCYLYFFSFFTKNIELEEEKQYLKKELEFVQNNYNSTFGFLHTLIHDNQKISEDFENNDPLQAKEHFKNMNEKAIKKFNSLYTGNISLSIALSNIDWNKNIQHFVGCDLNEFEEDDLTLFFMNTLNMLKNQKEISILIQSHFGNKIISFKTTDPICYDGIEKVNLKFIKKYKLKQVKEENGISFIRLNAK